MIHYIKRDYCVNCVYRKVFLNKTEFRTYCKIDGKEIITPPAFCKYREDKEKI